MKRLSTILCTLALLLVGASSAKAQEDPGTKIYEYDYSTKTSYDFYRMSDLPQVVDGVLTVTNPTSKSNWEVQYFVGDGVSTKENGSYIVRFEIKGSKSATIDCNMGNWSEALTKQVSFTNEWSVVDVPFRGICASSFLVFQSGSFDGTLELKKVQVFEISLNQEIGNKVHECDYSTLADYPFYRMSDIPQVVDGVLTIDNPTKKGNWEVQYFVEDNVPCTIGKDYVMRVTIKGSESGSLDTQMGDWTSSTGRKLFFTDEWQTLDIWFFGVPASSSHIVFQSGGFQGKIEVKKVEVYEVNNVEVVLLDGFKELTLDMCQSWDSPDAGATPTGSAGEMNLNTLLKGGDVVYGGNVPWSVYADITGYSKLIVTGTSGFPARVIYNRAKNSDDSDGTYQEVIQNLNEHGYTEFNLLTWGSYAHLNSIKRQGWGGDADKMINQLLLLGKDMSVVYAKVGATGFATFSATSDVNLLSAKGYAAKYEGGVVKLTEVTKVPAGAGVILEAVEGTYAFPVVDDATALDNDLLVSDGSVKGNGTSIYALGQKGGKVGFVLVKNNTTIPEGKAYLNIAGGAREFIGFGDEDATGIDAVKQSAKADNLYFNLAGQRVAQPTKGLYIVNGKKVIVK